MYENTHIGKVKACFQGYGTIYKPEPIVKLDDEYGCDTCFHGVALDSYGQCDKCELGLKD